MTERPIPFGTPMIRALLQDRKRQTRRICKQAIGALHRNEQRTWAWGVFPAAEPGHWVPWFGMYMANAEEFSKVNDGFRTFTCPYGMVGDQLWVTEVWTLDGPEDEVPAEVSPEQLANWRQKIIFHADCSATNGYNWRAPFVLPRWASRITLEITEVRIERLHVISDADARAEGVVPYGFRESQLLTFNAQQAFTALWDSIYLKRGNGWDENPWVWVISFRRI